MRPAQTDLGGFVRDERHVLGWTQFDVAMYAGVSSKFVSDLEAGKRTLRMDTVNKVLGLFGKRLGLADLEPRQ